MAKKKKVRQGYVPAAAEATDGSADSSLSPEEDGGRTTPSLEQVLCYLLIGLTALFLLGAFSTEVADTDFWWHLKTGEYVLNYFSLPVPDPFSYASSLGEPAYEGEEKVRHFNLTHEWLAQIIWYLIYSAGGFPGLVLWKALLLACLCGAAGYLAACRSGSLHFGIAAALAGVPIAEFFASDRPALVTFVLVALLVVLLERYTEGGASRFVWILPPLMLVWANLHGGFFMGWVVLGIYCVGAFQLEGARRSRLWQAAGAALLVSGINPNSFAAVSILLAYRESPLTSTLIEWQPPFIWGPPYTFNLLLYSAAAAMLWNWRRVRLTDGLLVLAFGLAAMIAFRNIIFIAFFGPVMLARYGWPMVVARVHWRPLRWQAGLGALAAVAVLGGYYLSSGALFQLRAAEWKFPKATAEFIRKNSIDAPMFNSYEQGGFWIWELWPLQQTFVDGRALNESVYGDYRVMLYGLPDKTAKENRQIRRRLFEKYGMEIVVMNSFEFVRGTVYPLALDLTDPVNWRWKLIFEDTHALVFAKNNAANRELIANYEVDKARAPKHLIESCEDYIRNEPLYPNCAKGLGMHFFRTGDGEGARRMLALYLGSIDYPDDEAQGAYARLLAAAQESAAEQ